MKIIQYTLLGQYEDQTLLALMLSCLKHCGPQYMLKRVLLLANVFQIKSFPSTVVVLYLIVLSDQLYILNVLSPKFYKWPPLGMGISNTHSVLNG